MTQATSAAETTVRPKKRDREQGKAKTKRQPPYAVVLHNDPVNGFDFVVRSLRKVFGYDSPKAFWLTLKAHSTGRSHVWTGSLEVAELKRDQLRSCGADPAQLHAGATTLGVTIESLPGE